MSGTGSKTAARKRLPTRLPLVTKTEFGCSIPGPVPQSSSPTRVQAGNDRMEAVKYLMGV